MDNMSRDRLSFGTALAAIVSAAILAGIFVAVFGSSISPRPQESVAAARVGASNENDRGSQVAKDAPSAADVVTQRSAAVTPPAIPAAPASREIVDQNNLIPDPQLPLETNALPVTASTTFPSTYKPNRKLDATRRGQTPRGLTILQIGDSHTSADFFSGELRQRLQQRYGSGGAGYLPAGRPHIGVRSSALKVAASSGWTYRAIQKSDDISQFWLSGFNAVASVTGETLSFTSEGPLVFDSIEIEALRQPGGGAIEISLDGVVKSSFDLNAKTIEPLVLRLSPDGVPNDRLRKIEIRTRSEGSVNIASVGVFNKQSGISYSSIGYPGASIDLLNKFDQNLMADDLRRLNPQIVVLAFGTNEASNKNLDPDRYQNNYEKAIGRITSMLPDAKIVLIGPPDGAERPSHCGKPALDTVCRAAKPESASPSSPSAGSQASDCNWSTLPKLEMVRSIVRKIAEQRGFTYWNWASIMPRECGTHIWATASPPLMASDHVHFTIAGYNKSAENFLNTLIPVIEKLRTSSSIASDSRSR
jgi:lysophospholipase L1-like esterase